MSHIFPLEGQRHFNVSSELTSLGGNSNENFRLAYAWDGEHYFEIPDNTDGDTLFDKWVEFHGGDPTNDATAGDPEQLDGEAPADSADPTGTPAAPALAAPATDADSTTDNTDDASNPTTTEPPAESTQDDAAAVKEPATDDAAADEAAPDNPKTRASTHSADTTKKAGSTTSGTTRKRSAKNSNRRS